MTLPALPRTGRGLRFLVAEIALGLGLASAVTAILESGLFGIQDASPVYLVPVVTIATRYGTGPGS